MKVQKMRDIIQNHKQEWWGGCNDPRDQEIQKMIMELDQTGIFYEGKWGVGFLQESCSGELLEKWQSQCNKFDEALKKKDVNKVRELTMGFKRAYEALEGDVLSKGYTPREAHYISYTLKSGRIIVIALNNQDMAKAQDAYRGKDNVQIWCLSEVANILDGKTLLDVVESKKSLQLNLEAFDFEKGDEVKF